MEQVVQNSLIVYASYKGKKQPHLSPGHRPLWPKVIFTPTGSGSPGQQEREINGLVIGLRPTSTSKYSNGSSLDIAAKEQTSCVRLQFGAKCSDLVAAHRPGMVRLGFLV